MPSAVVLFGATRRHSTVDDAQRESYLVLSPGYFLCRCRRVTPTHKPRDTGKEKEKNLLKDKKKKGKSQSVLLVLQVLVLLLGRSLI